MKIFKVKSSQGALGKVGSEKGVDEVVKALDNFYLDENGLDVKGEIIDIKIVENNIEETNENIFNAVKGKEGIIIGGDHSITYPSFSAFAGRFKNPGLIVFDAHPDCENNFKPPSHEDFLRVLIEEGRVKPENVVLVGIRNWHINEYKFLKDKKIKVFSMKRLFSNLQESCDDLMEIARDFDGLYLSLDIDAVDPAFAPGTGYCEPGGLTSREMIYLLQRLKLLKNLKMIDLVEINPDKDVNNMTINLGAKMLKELMSH